MGHNPSPSAIQEVKGYFQKNPDRKRPKEPKPKKPLVKTPPKEFTDQEKAVWRELMKMLPPGVAFDSDKWALRHLVILEAKSRECHRTGSKFTDSELRVRL